MPQLGGEDWYKNMDSHPHRCKGRSRVAGRRCRRYASRGSHYCKFHGGRRFSYRNPDFKGFSNLRYSKYLGKTLRSYIEQCSGAREALIELRDELAMMRALAGKAIELYEDFNARPVGEGGFANHEEKGLAIAKATDLMVNCLNQVKDMAIAAARLEQQDSVGNESLNAILIQVVSAIDHKVRDIDTNLIEAGVDPEAFVTSIADDLKNNIRVLKQNINEGVDHTPSDLVDAMDSMQ